ncbi:hypothetical protein CRUP_013474 [Coryphaenoides rupestris]|nr:hypothetical protein CRUP_013474 [Coryphaenoides rupestris]
MFHSHLNGDNKDKVNEMDWMVGKMAPDLEEEEALQQQVLGPAQVELQVGRLLQTAGQEEEQLLHDFLREGVLVETERQHDGRRPLLEPQLPAHAGRGHIQVQVAELDSVSVPGALVHQRQTAKLCHLPPVQELLATTSRSH